MPWPTPWFVGGANHSADIARILPYAAFAGTEGVMGSLDCRILELATPGTSIRCMPGGTNIRAKGMASSIQAYADYLASQDEVPISATDSSGGRSDLVIARVEDPNQPGGGWTATSTTDGPFQFTRIIPNVAATTTHVSQVRPDDSAITLARIDIPASTGTITQDMIVDLRSVIGPSGSERIGQNNTASYLFTATRTSTGAWTGTSPGPDPLESTTTTFQDWPAAASFADVSIPSWATHFDFEIKTANIHHHNGPFWGEWRWARTDTSGAVSAVFPIDLNQPASQGGSRDVIWIGGESYVDPAIRGTTVGIKMQARSLDGTLAGILSADRGTVTFLSFNFKRKPVMS